MPWLKTTKREKKFQEKVLRELELEESGLTRRAARVLEYSEPSSDLIWVNGVQLTAKELCFLRYLEKGAPHYIYGSPTRQSNAQLAETFKYGNNTEEQIAQLIESLAQKGLLLIQEGVPYEGSLLENKTVQERAKMRFLNTITARSCGL